MRICSTIHYKTMKIKPIIKLLYVSSVNQKTYRIMKLLVLCFMLTIFNAVGSVFSQKPAFNFNYEDISVGYVLQEIEAGSEYKFLYRTDQLDLERTISLSAENNNVEDILEILFSNENTSYRIFEDNIIAITTNWPGKQQIVISGQVTDNVTGYPLPGTTILVQGTTMGTTTGVDGEYRLTVPSRDAVLVFSYVGYVSQEIAIGEQNVINVELVEDVRFLDELVVVGYATQRRVNLTGSITVVNTEGLSDVPVPTLTQSLMGRSPGIFIKNTQGQPGDTKISMNIRGFGSPLIIVDGTPVSTRYFHNLDPSEIEDISVLKDGASAAVYGARAGNGVILVSTKRGRESPPEFTYSSNYALQYITQMQQPVASYQYAQMENLANFNEGKTSFPWTEEEIQTFRDGSDPVNYPNVDVVAATLRPFAPQHQHNLNVRGGTDRNKYFASISFLNQGGMLKSNDIDHNRVSLRSNVDVKLTDNFDVGFDLSFTNQDYIGPRADLERTSRVGGLMTVIFRNRPYWPLDPYPDPTKVPAVGSGASTNPVAVASKDISGFKKWNRLYGYGKLNFSYNLPLGFRARAVYDMNRAYYRFKDKEIAVNQYDYIPETDEYIVRRVLGSSAELFEDNSITQNINQQYFLTWDRGLGDHNFNALFVYELLSDTYDRYWASRRDYEFPLNYLFAGPDMNKDNSGVGREGGRKAYIGRFNYNYQGKYLLEVNSRWDASPNFPPETRWGVFPSVSIGWRISEEGFISDNLPFVHNLKIRASHGRLGYDRAGDFQYLSTYSLSSRYIFEGNQVVPSIIEDALPNPYITWEKMTASNIGLDFNLFGNLLGGYIDYFYRKRTDVLGSRSRDIPDVVGATMPRENYREYDNRGMELSLDHMNRIGNTSYTIGANVAWNREKLLFRDEPEYASMEAWRRGNQIGQWTDRWWTLPTDGLFKTQEEIDNWADIDGQGNRTIMPGDVKFIDTNGDGRITNEDMIIAGRGTMPRLMYGLQMSLKWKGFDFNMLWQGAGLYNFNLRHGTGYLMMPFYSGISPQTFMYEQFYTPENPWIPANTDARWPIYRYDRANRNHRSYANSQHWLINGSYVRLKNLQLGYTIPTSVSSRAGISNFRIYVSGYNLLTISDINDYVDPEIDTSPGRTFGDYHPPMGMYNVGVLVNF